MSSLLAPLRATQAFARAAHVAVAPLSTRNPDLLRAQLQRAAAAFPHTPVRSWGRLYQLMLAAKNVNDPQLHEDAQAALATATITLGEFAAGVALLQSGELRDFAAAAAITHALTEQRRLGPAREALARAALLLDSRRLPAAARNPDLPAFERLAARLAHYDWQRDAARTHAERALALSTGDPEQEALSTLELARHLALYNPERAIQLAEEAEASFTSWQRPIDVCHARHVQALALQQMGRYAQSLALSQVNGRDFAELAMPHYVAWTENMSCINLWRLDRLGEALEAGRRAHAEFVARDLPTLVAMAANNLALVLTWRYEYSAAGALYEDATARCRTAGLRFDEARCLANLALIHEAVGRYDLALQTYLRSRDLLAHDGRETGVPICDQNIARVLLRLGEFTDAEPRLRLAREGFQRIGHEVDAAVTALLIAEMLLATGEAEQAVESARRAEAELWAQGHTREALVAQRLGGQALVMLGELSAGGEAIAAARAAFEEMGLAVEAALSTSVLPGVQAGELLAAANLLDDALPDQAWRAWHALARSCENAQQQAANTPEGEPLPCENEPLSAWTETVRRLVRLRAAAPTEQESAAFFEAHAPIFDEAMAASLRVGNLSAALAAADAALTPAFAAQLARHTPALTMSASSDDPYLTRLVDDEARARSALETARTELRASAGDVSRNLSAVRELAVDHARSLSRLRIARPRAATLQPPTLLEPDILRARCANAHGSRWACLSLHYNQATSTLVLFWLDAERLERFEQTVRPIEAALLRQATDPSPSFRRFVYEGSAYGQKVSGPAWGPRLGRALLPRRVWELMSDLSVLYVATHGLLQNLALPILTNGTRSLLQYAEVVHVPSLTALQRLLERRPPPATGASLIVGVEEFGARAPRLPATRLECLGVADAMAGFGATRILWQEEATRGGVQQAAAGLRSASVLGNGAHSRHDQGSGRSTSAAKADDGSPLRLLHLATHARAERLAPLRSRILLNGNDELTAPEIVGLNLECDLVTLSACSGAAGEPLAGNELQSLAYAFLQGGARAVLAALWPVGDEASAAFMAAFYREMAAGPHVRPASALRRAQNAQAAGSPLDWAGYRLIGAA